MANKLGYVYIFLSPYSFLCFLHVVRKFAEKYVKEHLPRLCEIYEKKCGASSSVSNHI